MSAPFGLPVTVSKYTVNIRRVKDLLPTKKLGSTGLYCECSLGTQGPFRTSTKFDTANPTWDESFDFEVPEHQEESSLLKLSLARRGEQGAGDLTDVLGVATFTTSFLGSGQQGDITMELYNKTDKGSNERTGTVEVHVAKVKAAPGISTAPMSGEQQAAPAPPAAEESSPRGGSGGVLHLVQEKLWVAYLVAVVALLIYRWGWWEGIQSSGQGVWESASSAVAAARGPPPEAILLKPKEKLGAGKPKASSTHRLLLREDGNLVILTGAAPEEGGGEGRLVWESQTGQEDGCKKCKAVVTESGSLEVHRGKDVLASFDVEEVRALRRYLHVA